MKTNVNEFLETIENVQPIDGNIFKNLYESFKKRDIKTFLLFDLIENVQPMSYDEYKKFSKNSLFKINHIKK